MPRERMVVISNLWLMRGFLPITPTVKKKIKVTFFGFRATVKLASHFELIGGSLVAGV
jgi:uncharacterized membrane protein